MRFVLVTWLGVAVAVPGGVTCPAGAPSASFTTVNGIVTHC